MTIEVKRRARFYGGILAAAAVFGLLCIWAFSRPRTPLEYLVAGTFATSILLAALFVQIVKRGYLGSVRRGETSTDKPRTPAG